jgi:hypothetical protein
VAANWSSLNGKPFITVSPKGISNGQSSITNDGSDYGPDTPGTTTYGIQEALNSIAPTGGMIYCRKGTYNVSSPIQGTGSNQTVWFEPGSTIVFASTTTPWTPTPPAPPMFISIASNIQAGSGFQNYSHVHWFGNGTVINVNGAGTSTSAAVFGLVQAGFYTTPSPPPAGEDFILDDFVLQNVPNTTFFVSVDNYGAGTTPVPSTQQIRNVRVSRIYATWYPTPAGVSGFVLQGSIQKAVIEDSVIDVSAVTNTPNYSNCFVRGNAGDSQQITIRRCTFIQHEGTGNVFEFQANTSSSHPGVSRDIYDLLVVDCVFDSSSSTPQFSNSGGGLIDDNGGTGNAGHVYNLEFRRCFFANVGVTLNSGSSKFGYLRFADGSTPGGFQSSLLGRGPDDPGIAAVITPASPPTFPYPYYTNTDGFDEDIIATGGSPPTGASIYIDGYDTKLVQGVFRLREGDTLEFVGWGTNTLPTLQKQSR